MRARRWLASTALLFATTALALDKLALVSALTAEAD
jgi:hypothetical protein